MIEEMSTFEVGSSVSSVYSLVWLFWLFWPLEGSFGRVG